MSLEPPPLENFSVDGDPAVSSPEIQVFEVEADSLEDNLCAVSSQEADKTPEGEWNNDVDLGKCDPCKGCEVVRRSFDDAEVSCTGCQNRSQGSLHLPSLVEMFEQEGVSPPESEGAVEIWRDYMMMRIENRFGEREPVQRAADMALLEQLARARVGWMGREGERSCGPNEDETCRPSGETESPKAPPRTTRSWRARPRSSRRSIGARCTPCRVRSCRNRSASLGWRANTYPRAAIDSLARFLSVCQTLN